MTELNPFLEYKKWHLLFRGFCGDMTSHENQEYSVNRLTRLVGLAIKNRLAIDVSCCCSLLSHYHRFTVNSSTEMAWGYSKDVK